MEEQNQLIPDSVRIDTTAAEHIRSMASWAMIIVVTSVIGYVLSILELFITPADLTSPQPEGFSVPVVGTNSSIGGTIFAILLGLAVNYFLYRFASGIKTGVNSMQLDQVNHGFRHLKMYFTISTILMIIVLLFLLVAMVAIL
jgi:hypothetical protein